MSSTDSTCWTVIERAAQGSAVDRETFARRYLPSIRAYLLARWGRSPFRQETDDAVQEVFVECFRSALARTARDRTGSFRAYLYGVVRNVARRVEERGARRAGAAGPLIPDAVPADEPTLSEVFDRAWAVSVLEKARARQEERAKGAGDGAERRIELLRLRLEDDLPIREIAGRWECDAAWLHHQYARARQEFREALLEVVAYEHSGTRAEIERECARLVSFFR